MKKTIAKRPATKATKVTMKKPATKLASGPSQFSGQKLFPKVKTNPRREGSHGHRSMSIILVSVIRVFETSSGVI